MKKSIKPRALRLSTESLRPLTLQQVTGGKMIFETLWFGGCAPHRPTFDCLGGGSENSDGPDPGGSDL